MIKYGKILYILLLGAGCLKLPAQKFEWAKHLGGNNADGKIIANVITTDADENVYVSGTIEGKVDLDPGEKTYSLSSLQQGPDIFLCKLNSEGKFLWAKHIQGIFYETCLGIKIDKEGNIIMSGYFSDKIDFNPGEGVFELSAMDYDIFVLKLNKDGEFIWAKQMGGEGAEICNSLALDESDDIYISGHFSKMAHFGINESLISLTSRGAEDVFICKLKKDGTIAWAKSFGGHSLDHTYGITTDKNANVYLIGGFFQHSLFEGVNERYAINSYGDMDVFILKMTGEGKFVWTKRIGSVGDDFGRAITIDAKENLLITGSFRSKIRIVQDKSVFDLYATTGIDAAFICKMDLDGKFTWAKSMGYVSRIDAYGIAVDDEGDVYTAGTFSASSDFNPGEKGDTLYAKGNGDVYLSKLKSNGDFGFAKSFGGEDEETAAAITVSSKGNVFMTGTFKGKVDFDPDKGESFLETKSLSSVYVVKLKGKK